ncbi:MAG: F0F1 ATP synthase subunit A [Acidobacteriota bacterium]
MSLALFFWQHAQEAEHATQKGGHGGEHHIPWLVKQVNHLLGPLVYPIQKSIMTAINPEWHGDPAEAIPTHIVMLVVAFLICTLGLYLFRGKLSVENPSNRQQVLENVVLQVRDILDQVIGPYGRKYLPVIGSFAVFILIGNLMGIIPGLVSPTVSINVTLALGITSFVYYMGMGFKQQGIGYLKHFTAGLTGAMLPLGLVILVIELISNFVRPATLGVRLFINIYVDEKIAEVFGELAPWGVPAVLLSLAVFVAFVQTFIFVTLSTVYLSETVPHDDHHDEHEHGGEAHAH